MSIDVVDVFRRRDDPAAREAYMQRVEAEAAERGPRRAKAKKKAAPSRKRQPINDE